MITRASTLIITAIFALCLALQPAFAQPEIKPDASVVSASGTARVYRTPDYLDIIVGVVEMKPTAGEAQTGASTRMEAILVALKALNLTGAEYQTGTVDLSPRYNDYYREQTEQKIIGYTAVNTLRVRTTDLKAAARIIDAALKAGANRIDSVIFGLKQYLDAREEALTLATKAAKRKATVLVEALDAKLGKVLRVNEDSAPMYFGNRYAAQVQTSNIAMDGGQAPLPGEDAFEPGKVEVVVTVTLTCEIKDQK